MGENMSARGIKETLKLGQTLIRDCLVSGGEVVCMHYLLNLTYQFLNLV